MPTNPKRGGSPRGYTARVVQSSQGYKSSRTANKNTIAYPGHVYQDPRVGQGRMPWRGKVRRNVNKAKGGWWQDRHGPRSV